MSIEKHDIHTMPLPDFAEDAVFKAKRSAEPDKNEQNNYISTGAACDEDAEPVDLLGRFPTPSLPIDLLPEVIRRFMQAGVAVARIIITPEGVVTIVPAGMPGDDGGNPCDRLLKR